MKTLSCSLQGDIQGEIRLPTSKSISNRLLIMRHLSGVETPIQGLSQADDTQLLLRLLEKIEQGKRKLNTNNAGTVFRFLTAVLAQTEGEFVLDGSARMRERPIGVLVDALRSLGSRIDYLGEDCFPPLQLNGNPNLQTKTLSLEAGYSSQYISALLMIAPRIKGGLSLLLAEEQVSMPYIRMTLELMKVWGIDVQEEESKVIIPEQAYKPVESRVEADWSSAAFFYELAALRRGCAFFFPDLRLESVQGDAKTAELFKLLGVESRQEQGGIRIYNTGKVQQHIQADFRDYPDLALPFITACAALQVIGRFSGLESLQHKESNRMEVLAVELAKAGVDLRDNGMGEWVLINACRLDAQAALTLTKPFQTYDDHRMAMCLAPLVLKSGKVQIEHPEVVTKSFPWFWQELQKCLV